jgi:hypothetical protein
MQRVPGAGTPTFFVTRSGNRPTFDDDITPDDPGELLVVELATRDRNGERVRSNRLLRGADTESTAPATVDRVVHNIEFDGLGGRPHYGHPGGLALVDGVLLVPLEAPKHDERDPATMLALFDVRTPTAPRLLKTIALDQSNAGVAAVVQHGGRLLLLLTGEGNETLWLYEGNGADLRSASFTFNPVGTPWSESELVSADDWPTGAGGHQTLFFAHDCDGRLYLMGARNDAGGQAVPPYDGDDRIDLYEASFDSSLHLRLEQRDTRHLWCRGGDAGQLCDLAAASAFHATPAGELILYASEHENEGPLDTVRMGEFRSNALFWDGSPNWAPTARAGGPYTINEGSSVRLDGSATTQPVAKPWAELYADERFEGESVVLDWDDRNLDDYDDFDELDDFDDEAHSLVYVAPEGCDLHVYEDADYEDSELVFAGTGRVERILDLDARPYGFGDEIDSMRFLGPSCPSTALSFAWDNGLATGATPTVSPALNGPVDHPLLLRSCGAFLACDDDRTNLHVANLPPRIVSLTLPVTSTEGAQVAVNGTIVDPSPGALFLDVTVDWGDGTVVSGRRTTISERHTYADNGVYALRIEVCDDDGACVSRREPVIVSNVAPAVAGGADATLSEGTTYKPQVSFTDPGFTSATAATAETFTATIDWGDRSSTTPTTIVSNGRPGAATAGGFAPVGHRYADNGVYTVTVTVRDDDGGVATDTMRVTVTNAAPVVGALTLRDETGRALGAGDVVLVRLRVDLAGAFTDAGSADTHTAVINWGDAQLTTGTVDPVTRTVTGWHEYATGTHVSTIAVTLTDDDGASAQRTLPVTVVTPAGAVADAIADLAPLANSPAPNAPAHQALRAALDRLQGSNGGAGTDGAADHLAVLSLLPAVDQLSWCLVSLGIAEAADGTVRVPGLKAQLVLTAKSLAVDAIRQGRAAFTAPADLAALAQAELYLSDGDARHAAGDHPGATQRYYAALREILARF